jgi:hypothetical protein
MNLPVSDSDQVFYGSTISSETGVAFAVPFLQLQSDGIFVCNKRILICTCF